jgi:signal transduction histidine kinase
MRILRTALWPAAVAFGITAELGGQAPLPALDAATGFSLLGFGLLAWYRRPRYAVGWILAAASITWFLGTVASWAVFLHRGPLAQLLVTYPARRLWPTAAIERLAVVLAYGYAIPISLADSDIATIMFAVVIVGLAAWRYLSSHGPQRRARASALAVAIMFATVLVAAASMRLAGAAGGRGLLIAYECVVVLGAAGLTADLFWGDWSRGLLASLVVDLGEPTAATSLRDRLARVLGDPTLIVGYWVPDQARYVDESGQPVTLPNANTDRAVRQLQDDDGRPLGVLIHDPASLEEPDLVADIAAATRLAVTNARLQAEIRGRVRQVEISRRHLVEAADEQRRQLERQLRGGAEQRLAQVAELLGGSAPELAELKMGLDAARTELRDLARGIHPATLTNDGLRAAILEVVDRSPIPVEIIAPAQRWPPAIEAAAYFVCAEALANTAKHAHASNAQLRITADAARLHIEIADDGVGGATTGHGSGLRGLGDRIAALGGQLKVESPVGEGTRLAAQLPLRQPILGAELARERLPGPNIGP